MQKTLAVQHTIREIKRERHDYGMHLATTTHTDDGGGSDGSLGGIRVDYGDGGSLLTR